PSCLPRQTSLRAPRLPPPHHPAPRAPPANLVSFFHHSAPTDIYTLSLHDALPILSGAGAFPFCAFGSVCASAAVSGPFMPESQSDRKSTRLNSSHVSISYAVFCFKKKTLRCGELLWNISFSSVSSLKPQTLLTHRA